MTEDPHFSWMQKRLVMETTVLKDIEEGCDVSIPAGSTVRVYTGPPNNNLRYNLQYNGYCFRDTVSYGCWTKLP